MYFLIQSNIYSDPDHDRIYGVLDELVYPYETIEVLKDTKQLELKTNRQDIFVYGSVRLARLSLQYKDWSPNSFYGNNHLFEIYSNHYKEHTLNYDFQVLKLTDEINWSADSELFIKPYRDAKVFTGKVFNATSWFDYVYQALESQASKHLNKDTLIQISKPQKIYKEARLWIVDQQIVDAGYYKFNEDTLFELNVALEGIAFAKEMITIFNVAEAFVMDIGLTENGWKIIEVNCINSSGFYPNTNIKSIFRALYNYFSSK